MYYSTNLPWSPKKRMQELSIELAIFLKKPSVKLNAIMVKINSGGRPTFINLGDPFEDLRKKKKRPTGVVKCSVRGLLPDYD